MYIYILAFKGKTTKKYSDKSIEFINPINRSISTDHNHNEKNNIKNKE